MQTGQPSLERFVRFMRDLDRGSTARNCFEPWEVDLLVDLEMCAGLTQLRQETLRRYRKATEKRLECGDSLLKLSEYLVRRAREGSPLDP